MSKRLLIVEDSQLVLKVLRRLADQIKGFEADFAETYGAAKALIENNEDGYFACLVDLNLPDAPNGEVVELTLSHKIPTLVLTATIDAAKRSKLFDMGIADYIVKESRYAYAYAMKLAERLFSNQSIKIMVVDDSLVARKQAASLLRQYLFQVLEAESAKSAIRQLIDQPDIKIVITDYHMPEIDGFELVKLLRGKYNKQDLTIIGLSGEGDASLSARFIKHGANDFLRKPFNQEEFYCRIMHNVESIEAIEQIRDSANRDYLTGLFNRQYFYQKAAERLEACQQNGQAYALAIIDIDGFREFSNVYTEYGDAVLVAFAEQLDDDFNKYYTARLNGIQLVLFMWQESAEQCEQSLNSFREKIKSLRFETSSGDKNFSVSIGLKHSSELGLRQLLENCDVLLQRAQEAGSDLVISEE